MKDKANNEHEIENRAEWLLANAQNIWKIQNIPNP